MSSIGKCRFVIFVGLVVISLGLAFAAPPAFAQGFDFTNFSSTANLTLNVDAAQHGNVLRLTPALTSQVGSAWYNTQQPVQQGFVTIFKFRISNSTPPSTSFPADGFAFVIQNSAAGTAAIGPDGGGIGYGSNPDSPGTGIANSLAVEFDTFQNTGDPNGNHVAIQNCGTGPNSSNETATFGESSPCNIGINASLPITLADGNEHTVVISYEPPGARSGCDGPCPGTLSIFLDGSSSPILTTSVDLSSRLNLNGGMAWVGFTGATGALVENNDILEWHYRVTNGATTIAKIHFNTGVNSTGVAVYDCPSDPPATCSTAGASSISFAVGEVTTAFDLFVAYTKRSPAGNGVCESGDPNDTTDIPDCQFVTHFGTPLSDPSSCTVGISCEVPFAEAYALNGGTPADAWYDVVNPPPTSFFKCCVYWYAVWNTVQPSPPGYGSDERLYDNPSAPHPSDANQYTRDITTYNKSITQVGAIDPKGVGGTTTNFNKVIVGFPPQPKGPAGFVLLPPLSVETEFDRGETIPIKFQFFDSGNHLITTAVTGGNAVGIAILDSNGGRQPLGPPGAPPPKVSFLGDHYQVNFNTSVLAPGTYQLVINSNLSTQQTVTFTIEAED